MATRSIFKKTGKVLIYLFLLIIVVVFTVFIFINSNAGKSFVKNKIQSYLQKKLRSNVSIGTIDYSLPTWIEIKDIYIGDKLKDTLFYGKRLLVNINMLRLINGTTDIKKIELDSFYLNIYRKQNDSDFNYQFVADAFTNKDTATTGQENTLQLSLKDLVLRNARVILHDRFSGTDANITLKTLDLDFKQFQPQTLQFGIGQLNADGIDAAITINKSSIQDTTATGNNGAVLVSTLLNISSVNLRYENKVNGMFYANNVKAATLTDATFNMIKQEIAIGRFTLDNSLVQFTTPQSAVTRPTDTVATGWKFKLNELKLSNDRLQYDDNQVAETKALNPSHLNIKDIYAGTGKIMYSADSIAAVINQLSFKDKSDFIVDSMQAMISYTNKHITANKFFIKTPASILRSDFLLQYDDIRQITAAPANTRIKINLNNSTIAANDVFTIFPYAKQYLDPNKFRNAKIALNTTVEGSLDQLNIPLLQVSGLSGSSVNAKAVLYHITQPQHIGYDITVFNSKLLRTDIYRFSPPTQNFNINTLPESINLSAHLKGDTKNSAIDINLNGNGVKLTGNGIFKNINAPTKLQYVFNIKEGSINKQLITAIIPANSLPASVQLPELITVAGSMKGDMNNVTTNLKMGGSYGKALLKGYIYDFKNIEGSRYQLQLNTEHFKAGSLLKSDSVLGDISLTALATGKGLNYKTMTADIKIAIQQAEIKKYNYSNIDLLAAFNNGTIISNGKILDSNIQLQYHATAVVSGDYPSAVQASLVLDTLQLQKLHLYQELLNISFRSDIKAASLDPQHLNLYAVIDSSRVQLKDDLYMLDSMELHARDSGQFNLVTLQSPLADLTARGQFSFDKIGPSILQYINRYYKITGIKDSILSPQQITFNGVIKQHPLVNGFVPSLTYENMNFSGSFSSNEKDSALKLFASIPHATYNTNRIAGGELTVTTLNDKMEGQLTFDTLAAGSNTFYSTRLNTNIAGNNIAVSAVTRDQKDKERYAIAADISRKDGTYSFSLKDSLLLNYQKWNTDSSNRITYSREGLVIQHFLITNKDEKISINSRLPILNSPIDINIEKFNIQDISSFFNNDTLLASGMLNAQMSVSELDKKVPAFTGNIDLSQLHYRQQPIGDIKLVAKKLDNNSIDATLQLTGNGNELTAKATYYLTDQTNQFDATLNIPQLRMTMLQAFSLGNLSNTAGSINGNIQMNGTFSDPHWKGFIGFDTCRFTITKLGSSYSIDRQKIVLDYPAISFNQFTIQDSAGHALLLDGNIKSLSAFNYDLGLKLITNNFILVNTADIPNSQVYGYAAADANITITGNSSEPQVEGNISLNDSTDVTLVLPQANIDKDASKSIVRFVDRDTVVLSKKPFTLEKESKVDFARFINYNLNIEVNKNAAVSLIIDPTTGDELKLKGDAQLNAGVDPGGNIILAGNYELTSGHYAFNYQFLKKEFDLLPGSSIAFSGSPLDAQANITAVYTVNTSAKDLLGNEVGSVDPSVVNTFNQKIPFKVFLYLKGPIKKPEISFDIQMPDENTQMSSQLRATVEHKLSQLHDDVAATNKQVFSLLLLNRFTGEQSTDFFTSTSGGGGSGFDNIARQSVSKFISAALDQIATDLFKGVDINLNLNSYQDYSTGDEQQRTDLTVAITKKFLNDRLSVTVGKNFDIEGQDIAAKVSDQRGSGFVPDVTLNYKLTKDGKYLMRAYKKTQFEVILDGFVIETGVAFIVSMDYDKFKELFQKKNKREVEGK